MQKHSLIILFKVLSLLFIFLLIYGGRRVRGIRGTTFRSQSSAPTTWVEMPELRSLAWQKVPSPTATTVKELKQNLRCDTPRNSRLCCSRVSLLAFCAVFVLGSSELKAGAGKHWKVHRVSLTSITRRAPHSEGLLSERELFVRHP